MQQIGFSTGAIAKDDWEKGLQLINESGIDNSVVEISALHVSDQDLISLSLKIEYLKTPNQNYYSFHAPTKNEDERFALISLKPISTKFNIVIHPNQIDDFSVWRALEDKLLIENMDHRNIGRDTSELDHFFNKLPQANMCLDVAHAFYLDPSGDLILRLWEKYERKIKQIHISSIDETGKHHRIFSEDVESLTEIFEQIDCQKIPIIIESPAETIDDIKKEYQLVKEISNSDSNIKTAQLCAERLTPQTSAFQMISRVHRNE